MTPPGSAPTGYGLAVSHLADRDQTGGSPKPEPAEGGLGLLGVCITVFCVGSAHAIHLAITSRQAAATSATPG